MKSSYDLVSRQPLSGIMHLPEYNKSILINRVIHRNKTFILYDVTVQMDVGIQKRMILKQFSSDDNQKIAKKSFDKALSTQRKLCHSGAKTHVVAPLKASRDSGQVVLLDADWNTSVAQQMSEMDIEQLLNMIRQTAVALEALYREQVLIGDLRPENILLLPDHTVKFLNFDTVAPLNVDTVPMINLNLQDLGRLLYWGSTGKYPPANASSHPDAVANAISLALFGALSKPQQQSLIRILQNCISQTDSYGTSLLIQDLDQLNVEIRQAHEAFLQESTKVNAPLVAAHFIDSNPLYRYLRYDSRNRRELNVVLVGDAPVRTAFFETIFSGAQMLDTRLQIHVLAPDALQFYHNLVKKAPLLPHTARITLIQQGKVLFANRTKDLNGDIVEPNKPLAILHFTETDGGISDDQILGLNPGCILLMDEDERSNSQLAHQLMQKCRGTTLIGVGGASGSQLELCQRVDDAEVYIKSFPRDGSTIDATKLYRAQISKRALAVHTFYMKDNDERASTKTIRAKFRDSYNTRSSLRSAISIPYKLFSCGITEGAGISEQFCKKLSNKRLLSRLIWLEHRSWQAHMILEGWELLPTTDYNRVLFDPDNISHSHKHTIRGRKFHACLCASRDDGKLLPLSDWNWDDYGCLGSLDPLDRVSVMLHRAFADKAKETPAVIESLLEKLKIAAPQQLPRIRELENVVHQMQHQGTNLNNLWERVYQELDAALKDVKPCAELLGQIHKAADIIIKRNSYRDFKHSDLAVIEAIPFIILEKPVTKIYKLYSELNWENIITSVLVEPEELILVTDDNQDITHGQLAVLNAFAASRGLTNMQITHKPLNKLRHMDSGAVLDITGATGWQMHQATQHPVLKSLPVVLYKDGKMINPDGKYPNFHLYNRKRTLTVAETFALSGSRVSSERDENLMLGMQDKYSKLWEIAQKASYNEIPYYNNIITLLMKYTMADTGLYKSLKKEWPWSGSVDMKKVKDSGMMHVLDQLAGAGIITKQIEKNIMRITAKDADYQESINKLVEAMLNAMDSVEKSDRFELIKKTDANQTQFFVRDNCLACVFSMPIDRDNKVGKPAVHVSNVEKLLRNLYKEGFIQPYGNAPTVFEKQSNQLVVQFCYKSLAVRECLTKEGNALEVFAYHTIRQMNLFDDVKLSVNVQWAKDDDNAMDTTNEIDIIATKGFRSYFISCKKRHDISKEQLTEIRYETDHFGVDGTAILLATAKESRNQAGYSRARKMGVHIITLQDFAGPKKTEDSAKVLYKKLEAIVNLKEK